ncbi:MAG TPA: hypothetical protein VFU88_09910 [Ktedonobacterales bacterium]|nr:hypothetical protein [Ktedonobacterales bacterium]
MSYRYTRPSLSSPTTLGIDEKWERVLCYALLWVSGLVMFFIETKNATVRRHAMQSMAIFGGLSIIGLLLTILSKIWVIGVIFGILGSLVGPVTFVLWIVLMVLAYASPRTFLFNRFP